MYYMYYINYAAKIFAKICILWRGARELCFPESAINLTLNYAKGYKGHKVVLLERSYVPNMNFSPSIQPGTERWGTLKRQNTFVADRQMDRMTPRFNCFINSFAANVADRRRHSRLPTSPIGDLDTLPNPAWRPSCTDIMVCLRCF